MSLLYSEDLAIYQLRTSYLASIHDGIGERLININSSFLNDLSFKAAGWAPSASEHKRTYSPPIPTAVTSEYFQAPPQSTGVNGIGLGEDEEEGGMITGAGSGGNDTLGPVLVARRKRRKEQLEEDDSSDLSDESDDELDATQRPANQIKFARMPNRTRSGSSPGLNGRQPEGLALMITSPSRPADSQRLKAGSLAGFEGSKPRVRRDTTTSSEISSEPEIDPSLFRRQEIVRKRANSSGRTLAERIQELDENEDDAVSRPSIEVVEAESDDGSLSSGFSEAAEASSMLGGPLQTESLASLAISRPPMPRSISSRNTLQPPGELQALPPSRPISMVIPVSALAQAIKAKNMKPVNPFDRFATLSGSGDPNPLYIKIYVPHSSEADEPLEVVLSKATNDGSPVTVGEAIGFSLWKCGESGVKPPVPGPKMNVNWWTLRIVEDGEVDYDFPALTRTRPISDFTSNNNRGARGRSREKPWDEFALVLATDAQFTEHEAQTPTFSQEAAAAKERLEDDEMGHHHQPLPDNKPRPSVTTLRQHPITGGRFTANRQDSIVALDAPSGPTSHAIERNGAPKNLTVHYTDKDFRPGVVPIKTTTDTYLAEVFDQVCQKLNLDKALYVLKVTNTTTVAPTDRTVEALGPDRSSLDLVRRRFIGDGTFGFSGSPGSGSPNAPLLLTAAGTPKKPKRGAGVGGSLHPLAQSSDPAGLGVSSRLNANFRRYAVIRKQPMSFAPSHPRVIALDDEYLHIMPGEAVAGQKVFDQTQGKISTIHYSSVVGCKVNRKHPKTFRVVVFKERETKRYDFEAASAKEADEIVREIKKGMEPFKDSLPM